MCNRQTSTFTAFIYDCRFTRDLNNTDFGEYLINFGDTCHVFVSPIVSTTIGNFKFDFESFSNCFWSTIVKCLANTVTIKRFYVFPIKWGDILF